MAYTVSRKRTNPTNFGSLSDTQAKRQKMEGSFLYKSVSGVTYKLDGSFNPEDICQRCPATSDNKPRGIAQIKTDCLQHPTICINCLLAGQQFHQNRCQTCPEPTYKNEMENRRSIISITPSTKVTCIGCMPEEGALWQDRFSAISDHESQTHQILCPNRHCSVSRLSNRMPEHRKDCKHEQVACELKYKGCNRMPPHHDMKRHMDMCMFRAQDINGFVSVVGAEISLQVLIRLFSTPHRNNDELRLLQQIYNNFGKQLAPLLTSLMPKCPNTHDPNAVAALKQIIQACKDAPEPLSASDTGLLLQKMISAGNGTRALLKEMTKLEHATDEQYKELREYCGMPASPPTPIQDRRERPPQGHTSRRYVHISGESAEGVYFTEMTFYFR